MNRDSNVEIDRKSTEEASFQVGPIRPPSEANSLLLQVTESCSWNKCRFCMVYKEQPFHTRPVASILKDIDAIAQYRDMIMSHYRDGSYDTEAISRDFQELESFEARASFQMVFSWLTEGGSKAMFLQDANTMVLKTAWLVEIISYISEKLPELERITSYGRADTLARKSVEELSAIRAAGLNRIHSGYESGSDTVLEMIRKGSTQEDEIVGGKRVKEAGIELSIYFMPGVGGRELSEENAAETAKVINEVDPDFVRLRTFVLRNGSPMEELVRSGNYTECTDMEKLLEIRTLLTHIDPKRAHGKLVSDHIINLLQDVTGYLDKDLASMIAYIDSFLALPELEQKKFQLARRMGFPLRWDELYQMSDHDFNHVSSMAERITDPDIWEKQLHQFLNRYI